jgi:hypothetical protein
MVEIHQFAPVSYQLAAQNNLWLASGTGWLLLGTSSTIVHHAYVGPCCGCRAVFVTNTHLLPSSIRAKFGEYAVPAEAARYVCLGRYASITNLIYVSIAVRNQ